MFDDLTPDRADLAAACGLLGEALEGGRHGCGP
jgi:hypothetical protein